VVPGLADLIAAAGLPRMTRMREVDQPGSTWGCDIRSSAYAESSRGALDISSG
jgi:hypothetical protein